ncbi:hypothetical protein AX14_001081 [Amanita brunnescens Koide BX004]|nr:hypothetical protein AX14_001081 [Amanita brunnescens Koide BX004]
MKNWQDGLLYGRTRQQRMEVEMMREESCAAASSLNINWRITEPSWQLDVVLSQATKETKSLFVKAGADLVQLP